MGELVVDLQPVLEEDSTTQAEGAPVYLRKVPALPTRQVEAERGGSHLPKSGVAAVRQLFPSAQLPKGAQDPVAHARPRGRPPGPLDADRAPPAHPAKGAPIASSSAEPPAAPTAPAVSQEVARQHEGRHTAW